MKIMAIGFYRHAKLRLNALKATGWCDTYYLQPKEKAAGALGTVDELKRLNIDFKQYDAALIFQEGLHPSQKYFNEQCIKNNVTIYANQHGFNKSILQIVNYTPNIYSKYWNCMGKYFLDRFKEVMGRDPITQRWICIGSLAHDYLYKNYRWKERDNNGKALIIHEPDLKICEGDPHPHDSEGITNYIIKKLKAEGIEANMKVHPNWKNFIGNIGEPLDKPEGVNFVYIDVEDIVDYALVIGSRSTMLLDAVSMGIPTMALESSSDWEDDKYPPVEEGLIPTFSKEKFGDGFKKCFNKRPECDESFRNYFLGPLGKVADNYYEFIRNDLDNPSKILGKYYTTWRRRLNVYIWLDTCWIKRLYRKLKQLCKKMVGR